MSNTVIRTSQRLYDLLLRFYPKGYRQEFGKEMNYVFSQSLKDAYNESGEQGIFTVWARTIIDALKSLIREHLENNIRSGFMEAKKSSGDFIMQNKVFGLLALATAVILSIPYIAMQYQASLPYSVALTDRVDWKLGDFILMGILMFGTGFLFVHVARVTPRKYRTLVAIAFLGALLLTWIHLAVGIVDTWPFAGS